MVEIYPCDREYIQTGGRHTFSHRVPFAPFGYTTLKQITQSGTYYKSQCVGRLACWSIMVGSRIIYFTPTMA